MGIVIVANAITIGMQVEFAATQPVEDPPAHFRLLESIFCAIFTVELACRIYVFRLAFFRNSDWRWNLFDFLVVSLQLMEEAVLMVAVNTGTDINGVSVVDLRQIRMLRFLRVVRAVRVLRIVRFVQELSNITYLIVGSLWSFFWTFLFMMLLTYVIGTFVTQVVADHAVDSGFYNSTDLNSISSDP